MEKKSNKKTSKEATKKNGTNAGELNNNTAANVTTAEQPTAETERTPLATIGDTPIYIGDRFRLHADTTNDTAAVEIVTDPNDNARNADKPNCWREGTKNAYKDIQTALLGLRIAVTFTDDRRTTITEQATIVGRGMDTTNDRATFTLSTGRKIASGYVFKAIGKDDNYAAKATRPTAEEDDRPAALIRQDIAATTARIEKLTAKLGDLSAALTKALAADLAAVGDALKANPTDRRTLAAVIATPTANRIPADRLNALKTVEDIPAAAAAVRALIVEAYSEEALLVASLTAEQVTAAEAVADVMRAHALKFADIPTDLLPE